MNHDAAVLLVYIIHAIHAILGAAKQTSAFIEGLARDPRSLIMLAVTFAAEAASLLILIRSQRRSMIPRRCLLCLATLPAAARSHYCCEAHRAADQRAMLRRLDEGSEVLHRSAIMGVSLPAPRGASARAASAS
jgi:hypothetical protein